MRFLLTVRWGNDPSFWELTKRLQGKERAAVRTAGGETLKVTSLDPKTAKYGRYVFLFCQLAYERNLSGLLKGNQPCEPPVVSFISVRMFESCLKFFCGFMCSKSLQEAVVQRSEWLWFEHWCFRPPCQWILKGFSTARRQGKGKSESKGKGSSKGQTSFRHLLNDLGIVKKKNIEKRPF